MNKYQVKATLQNSEGKTVKENYACEAESSVLAEATVMMELSNSNIQEVPDINKKNWIKIIPNANGGDWYEVKGYYIDSTTDKAVKESYLVQEFSTKLAQDVVTEIQELTITNVGLTNIVGYFKQEENV